MSLLDTASLIVTPNGYKEGTLYSVIPSDGSGDMSVVRATTATRVNSAGLVELVPYNLVTWSEQFDNADWGKINSTISANTTTAPNGTMTADKFVENNGTGAKWVYYTPALSSGVSYTYSVYAKKGERDFLYINAYSGGGNVTWFNLNTGTIGTSQSGTPSIESVGNGWYRCSVTITSLSGAQFHLLGVSNADNVENYSGNGTSGIFIWGGQLNEGTIKDYQKTETRLNIPRLDYSNGTCPSLLVEPQRTNLMLNSSNFNNWLGVNNITITNNTTETTSPFGINNASKIVNGSSGTRRIYDLGDSIVGAMTFSVFVKAGTSDEIQLRTTSSTLLCDYNLSTETATPQAGTTATITPLVNGWYRITATATTILSEVFQIVFGGTTGEYLYLFGAQVEAGSYPTSYIPTTSASVTRNEDQISKTGISSLIGQSEGTLYFEGIAEYNTEICSINQNTQNSIFIYSNAGYGVFGYIYADGTSITFASFVNPLTKFKVAIAYKTNSMAMYINGNLIQEYTGYSFTPNVALTTLFIAKGGYVQGKEKVQADAIALWKTRLTNTQLAQLTTI